MTHNDIKCFVTNMNLALADKLKQDLLQQGFELKKPQYTILQAKKRESL